MFPMKTLAKPFMVLRGIAGRALVTTVAIAANPSTSAKATLDLPAMGFASVWPMNIRAAIEKKWTPGNAAGKTPTPFPPKK